MSIWKSYFTVVLTFLLAGCGERYDLAASVEQAKLAGSPYAAALKLVSDHEELFYDGCRSFLFSCHKEKYEFVQGLHKEYEKLVEEAIEEGNADATVAVLSDTYFRSSPLRHQAAAVIAKLADDASASKEVLLAAGQAYSKGLYAQESYVRAMPYYHRAWGLGSLKAADGAREIFESLKDIENAYLWGLRCMEKCTWSNSNYIKSLSAERVLHVQSVALDKGVAVLESSPHAIARELARVRGNER